MSYVSASGTPVTYFVVVVGQFPPVMFATVFDDLYDSSGAQSRHSSLPYKRGHPRGKEKLDSSIVF